MNDKIHTVVGVLPPLPPYPDDNDIWMPAGACPFRDAGINNRRGRMLADGRHAGAQLTDRSGRERRRDGLEPAPRRISPTYPAARKLSTHVVSLRDELTAQSRPLFLTLLAAAGFVLLIAMTNFAEPHARASASPAARSRAPRSARRGARPTLSSARDGESLRQPHRRRARRADRVQRARTASLAGDARDAARERDHDRPRRCSPSRSSSASSSALSRRSFRCCGRESSLARYVARHGDIGHGVEERRADATQWSARRSRSRSCCSSARDSWSGAWCGSRRSTAATTAQRDVGARRSRLDALRDSRGDDRNAAHSQLRGSIC